MSTIARHATHTVRRGIIVAFVASLVAIAVLLSGLPHEDGQPDYPQLFDSLNGSSPSSIALIAELKPVLPTAERLVLIATTVDERQESSSAKFRLNNGQIVTVGQGREIFPGTFLQSISDAKVALRTGSALMTMVFSNAGNTKAPQRFLQAVGGEGVAAPDDLTNAANIEHDSRPLVRGGDPS